MFPLADLTLCSESLLPSFLACFKSVCPRWKLISAGLLFQTLSQRQTLCILDLLNQNPPPRPGRPLLLESFPGQWLDQIRSLYLGPGGKAGLSLRWRSDMAACLLAVVVPSLLLHLLMWSSGSVPDPHVLGLILDGPHCSGFNEKDERGAGWENTQPSSSSSFPSPNPFTLLLVPFLQPRLALTALQQLTHPRLFAMVGGVPVRLVSILNFSGIIPSDLMCKFLPFISLSSASVAPLQMFKS